LSGEGRIISRILFVRTSPSFRRVCGKTFEFIISIKEFRKEEKEKRCFDLSSIASGLNF